MKKIFLISFAIIGIAIGDAAAAVAARTAVVPGGTAVRQRVEATGLYSPECHNAYFGCMDQFCISDNEAAGSCLCSDDNDKFQAVLTDVEKQLAEANNLRTIEVEKIEAGARADIIFTGERRYDAAGNVVGLNAATAPESTRAARDRRRAEMMSLWDNNNAFDLGNPFAETFDSIANQTGESLRTAAHKMCAPQMPASCRARDEQMITQLYSTQIRNDCRAFDNFTQNEKRRAESELAEARGEVRGALRASFEEANRFDAGTCLINFKQCMRGDDACGADWSRCASFVAAENMQNNRAISTARTTVATTQKFQISPSTLEMLDSKKIMCERILDQCMAVRDTVWPNFLRDIAPEMRLAELNLESGMRQSCMGDISACIQKACADPMIGQGGNIAACLDRNGAVARATCKNVIDPCERMEPEIWTYVVARLRSIAVDACTDEVRTCFTRPAPIGCGSDFSNCIGMDYNFMHQMCPLDSLPICRRNYAERGQEFKMEDLDRLLLGFWLNVDNAALENCQNLVETKMMEICGSTSDCNRFAADDTMGTGSLASQKDGGVYRISGMISFGKINVGNGQTRVRNLDGNEITLGAGMIDLRDYFESLGRLGVPEQYGRVVDNIYFELQNIQGTINRVIEMIELDPQIQYCINGRDTSQITGTAGRTAARFPNLLNQVKMQISVSALRAAQDNYNRKFNEIVADAMRNASVDMANLMCNKLPFSNGMAQGTTAAEMNNNIITPYAIVMEFAGVADSAIAAGGTRTSGTLGQTT
ncbi:MAG: hypothetical protein FWF34_01075, partial [Alphaproteobacteria bacterium]|nr:hypothetical protein [Alphaproteobacteria bacterium]